jgi:hypothetical protein
MNTLHLLPTSPMSVAPISTNMASCLKRPTRAQSVTSRSQESSNPSRSFPRAVSAALTSISAVAPLRLARVIHLPSITSRSQKNSADSLAPLTSSTAPEIAGRPVTVKEAGMRPRRTCDRTRLSVEFGAAGGYSLGDLISEGMTFP